MVPQPLSILAPWLLGPSAQASQPLSSSSTLVFRLLGFLVSELHGFLLFKLLGSPVHQLLVQFKPSHFYVPLSRTVLKVTLGQIFPRSLSFPGPTILSYSSLFFLFYIHVRLEHTNNQLFTFMYLLLQDIVLLTHLFTDFQHFRPFLTFFPFLQSYNLVSVSLFYVQLYNLVYVSLFYVQLYNLASFNLSALYLE